MLSELVQHLILNSIENGKKRALPLATPVSPRLLFETVYCYRGIVLHLVSSSMIELVQISEGGTLVIPFRDSTEITFYGTGEENTMKITLGSQEQSTLEDLTLPLHIVVGEIRMSVRDIIDLEAGMSCDVVIPEGRLANVYLGGECIADAELYMEENFIKLKILSVHLQQEDENSDICMDAVTDFVEEQHKEGM
jgi:flagellar motor switch/type III secretory pathway protein FliN